MEGESGKDGEKVRRVEKWEGFLVGGRSTTTRQKNSVSQPLHGPRWLRLLQMLQTTKKRSSRAVAETIWSRKVRDQDDARRPRSCQDSPPSSV